MSTRLVTTLQHWGPENVASRLQQSQPNDCMAIGYRREREPTRGLQANFYARAGVEEVTQRVANKVEREHCQHDRRGWKEDEMRSIEKMGAAIIEHCAPARRRRRNSQTQEAH